MRLLTFVHLLRSHSFTHSIWQWHGFVCVCVCVLLLVLSCSSCLFRIANYILSGLSGWNTLRRLNDQLFPKIKWIILNGGPFCAWNQHSNEYIKMRNWNVYQMTQKYDRNAFLLIGPAFSFEIFSSVRFEFYFFIKIPPINLSVTKNDSDTFWKLETLICRKGKPL